MFKILQTQMNLPHPVALVLNYAALDFNFTSWMTPQNLRVLQAEQSSGHLSLLPEQKDHLRHISPLSMVGDRRPRRRRSLRDTLRQLTTSSARPMPPLRTRHTTTDVRKLFRDDDSHDEGGAMGDDEDEVSSFIKEEDKPLQYRIRFNPDVDRLAPPRRVVAESPAPMDPKEQAESLQGPMPEATAPIGTRLTMTSRTGYFQDRIISPSMVSSSLTMQRHSVVVSPPVIMTDAYQTLLSDARYGDSLHRAAPQPRLSVGLPALSHPGTRPSPGAVPAATDDMRRKGPVRGRHAHLRRACARSKARPPRGARAHHRWKELPVWRRTADEHVRGRARPGHARRPARARPARGGDRGGLGPARHLLRVEPRVPADAHAHA